MDQVVIAIRQYILPWLEAEYPGIVVFLDNDQKNDQDLPDLHYDLEVMFYGSAQIGMAEKPGTRYSGYIYMTAFSRQGAGILASMRVLQAVAERVKYAGFDNVQLKAPALDGGDAPYRGWHSLSLKVPFHADMP